MENDLENKIQEGEISQLEKPDELKEDPIKKKKIDFYIEVVLFLILGILIGIAVKTEATKKITVGFDDYKMKIGRQDYDINKIEKDLAAKAAQNSQDAEENALPEGISSDSSNNSASEASESAQPAN